MGSDLKFILCLLALLAAFCFGCWYGATGRGSAIKDLTTFDVTDFKSMKEECEKSLPRDKFCTFQGQFKAN